jgi:hypothetical protein
VYPPNLVKAKRYAAPMRDDDRDSWWTRRDGPGTSASRVADDDRFEVGSGGRSGGGGASASWDAPADSAPVIVDPFASDSASGGGVVAADAADSESSGGETEADSGSDTASDGGSGTSY